MSEMDLKERQTGSELVFDGKILHLYHDSVALPNGDTASRELVRHVGAVCVLPITDDGYAVMERQYRYPVDRVLLEIPAGKLDSKQENHESAARRELEEETGYQADEFISLGKMLPTCAYDEEVIHMYLARGLHKTHQHLDEDEFLDVEPIPFQKLVDMVLANEIEDGKTQIMILKLKLLKDMGKL